MTERRRGFPDGNIRDGRKAASGRSNSGEAGPEKGGSHHLRIVLFLDPAFTAFLDGLPVHADVATIALLSVRTIVLVILVMAIEAGGAETGGLIGDRSLVALIAL